MYLMVDNFDSFVFNLVAYFQELNQEVMIRRNNEVSIAYIKALQPRALVISPGPKTPAQTGICPEIIQEFAGKIPILGVCLGHQTIAHTFGAVTRKGLTPVHGKVTPITHNGAGLFKDLPNPLQVTRYHSLVVDAATLPPEIRVDAYDENNTVMALSHRDYPIYGVQFHPEAVLTQCGPELLGNFSRLTEEWWQNNATSNQRAKAL